MFHFVTFACIIFNISPPFGCLWTLHARLWKARRRESCWIAKDKWLKPVDICSLQWEAIQICRGQNLGKQPETLLICFLYLLYTPFPAPQHQVERGPGWRRLSRTLSRCVGLRKRSVASKPNTKSKPSMIDLNRNSQTPNQEVLMTLPTKQRQALAPGSSEGSLPHD